MVTVEGGTGIDVVLCLERHFDGLVWLLVTSEGGNRRDPLLPCRESSAATDVIPATSHSFVAGVVRGGFHRADGEQRHAQLSTYQLSGQGPRELCRWLPISNP